MSCIKGLPAIGYTYILSIILGLAEEMTGQYIHTGTRGVWAVFSAILRHRGVPVEGLRVRQTTHLGEPAFEVKVPWPSGAATLREFFRAAKATALRVENRHFDKGILTLIAPDDWREKDAFEVFPTEANRASASEISDNRMKEHFRG